MGKQKSRSNSRTKSPHGVLAPRTVGVQPSEVHGTARRISRDVVLGLVVCVAFFLVLEILLRIAGVPTRGRDEDPYVGFSALQPLFTVRNGTAYTADSKLKYFNKISFPVSKQPSTTRVFCFGGSTTYGHPFDGRTAFPRWLGEILAASSPGKNFEVLNAGGISYASYRIKPLVREALGFQPDLIVILTGANEFLEWRTYGGLVKQGRILLAARSMLERLHIYLGLEILLRPLVFSRSESQADRNAHGSRSTGAAPGTRTGNNPRQEKTILNDEVTTILEQSAGLSSYHRDEVFSRGVMQQFARNLEDIIHTCKEASVPLILVEPVSNLKDFSPFKSEHGPHIHSLARARIDSDLQTARQLIQQRQFNKALQLLHEDIEVDPLFAMTHFLTGKALLGLHRPQEALQSLIRAKDLDVCPLRAPSGILQALRQAASNEKVPLIPFQELLANMPVPNDDGSGIPGNERLLDHVHPVIQGHQLLAEAIFQKMVHQGMVRPKRHLSRGEKDRIFQSVLGNHDQRFFALRDWNLAKTLYWAGKKEEARTALLRSAKHLYHIPEAHAMLGSFLLDDQNYREAVEEFEQAVAMSGKKPALLYGLAVAYYLSGSKDRAEKTLRLIVDAGKHFPDAYGKLASLYLDSGRPAEAIEVLKQGLERSPHHPSLLAGYGRALNDLGTPDKGIPWMIQALEREPTNPDFLRDLAVMYIRTDQKDKAMESLETAVRNGYTNLDRLAEDPVFEPLRQDDRFRAIVMPMYNSMSNLETLKVFH